MLPSLLQRNWQQGFIIIFVKGKHNDLHLTFTLKTSNNHSSKNLCFLKIYNTGFQTRVFHQMKITFLKFQQRTFVICSRFHWMVRIASNCPVIIVVSFAGLNSRKPSSGETLLLFIYMCLLSRMVVFFFFFLITWKQYFPSFVQSKQDISTWSELVTWHRLRWCVCKKSGSITVLQYICM